MGNIQAEAQASAFCALTGKYLMSVITRLATARSRDKKINIYLDGKYTLSLPADIVIREGLTTDQELSTSRLESLAAADKQRRAPGQGDGAEDQDEHGDQLLPAHAFAVHSLTPVCSVPGPLRGPGAGNRRAGSAHGPTARLLATVRAAHENALKSR